MIRPLSFDTFYPYEDLTELLEAWAGDSPDVATLTSIGHSWEGRDIWLVTLTDSATGPPQDKPAFFVEAGIHAAEWASTHAALHLIHRLLTGHGHDERVTRLLQTRTVYVVPRLGPDGAERMRAEGRYVRSSVRPHPSTAEPPGLRLCDVDGDGRALFMRVRDPDGPWKVYPREPRLLVPREPDEVGGDYFRVFQEGEILGAEKGTDGVVHAVEPIEGLDLGQNLPTDWAAAPGLPVSAGPFPGSEPEIQAVLRAVTDRPNITGYVTCHTFGGIHLSPPLNEDSELPPDDRRVYEVFGAKAAELTGYDVMSFKDLKHEPSSWFRGGQLGWYYHQLGLYAWITEFWSPQRAAGITDYHPSRWLLDHPVEDDLRMLRWSDSELDGRGFVDWYSFDHPQLGPVELGGWDLINHWYNPPLDRIEAEVAPHTEWVIFQALSGPRLEVRSLDAEEIAPGMHRVRLVLRNSGWLPTYVSRKALDRDVSGSLSAELELPPDARLVTGEPRVELGQLEGRTNARSITSWWGHDPGTPDLTAVEWVVSAPSGTSVAVDAHHPRAGRARAEIRLG